MSFFIVYKNIFISYFTGMLLDMDNLLYTIGKLFYLFFLEKHIIKSLWCEIHNTLTLLYYIKKY